MAGITTAFPTSFKNELAQAMHCFTGPQTITMTTVVSTTLTAMSTQANICRGMSITDSTHPGDLTVPTYIADLPTATTCLIAPIGVAAHAGDTCIISGDVFNVALMKHTVTGTYGAASTNYSNITGNSDEASGAGYAAGGIALTVNTTPSTTSGVISSWTWSTNPSWSGATISTDGCMFYNNSLRAGAIGRAIYVGSFGGLQQVTSGTLTLVLPANVGATAILSIS